MRSLTHSGHGGGIGRRRLDTLAPSRCQEASSHPPPHRQTRAAPQAARDLPRAQQRPPPPRPRLPRQTQSPKPQIPTQR
eukprot:608864-Pyramimonas_sp.AAC.1